MSFPKIVIGGRKLPKPVSGILELQHPLEEYESANFAEISDLIELRLMAPNSRLTSLDFLRGCGQLQALYINSMEVLDHTGIQDCTRLTRFGLGERSTFDFSCLQEKAIEEIKSYSPYITGVESLRAIVSLQRVELSGASLDSIGGVLPTTVSYVRLWDCRIVSAEGVQELQACEHLDLGYSRLEDIPHIGHIKSLRWVGLQGLTKLQTIDFLADLDLEYLIIEEMGEIRSLQVVQSMDNMRQINAYKTAFSDSDLSFLLTLPSLRSCLLDRRYRKVIEGHGKTNTCKFVFR